jgi:hypothetical protein
MAQRKGHPRVQAQPPLAPRRPGRRLAAVFAVVVFWALPKDPLEAARRRVPLGADREAVEAAVGRTADGAIGKSGRTAEVTRRVPFWVEGEAQLLVEFDETGRALKVAVCPSGNLTRWGRFRAWLGF